VSRIILLLMLSLPAAATTAEDTTLSPLLTYACDTQADTITVTNSLLKGNEARTYRFSDELGTYNPWDLVDVDSSSSHPKITARRKLVKECELSSGKYTVTIEPQTFGENLDGRCGAAISSALTVTLDGIDILERTPFEDYCHGNSPIIIRVTTFGATSEVKIKRIPKYQFY
jgi:hypothetical protein